MRVVLQRVSEAAVSIDNSIAGKIKHGILILVGFEDTDTLEDIEWMSAKICKLRIFNDSEGVMNLSIQDVKGDILLISQFTLHALYKKGNRPSYIKAAHSDKAIPLYESFKQQLQKDLNKPVKCGIFGAMMQVSLINDGPVTITMDTKNKE